MGIFISILHVVINPWLFHNAFSINNIQLIFQRVKYVTKCNLTHHTHYVLWCDTASHLSHWHGCKIMLQLV
jgi:hypothetical protein